MLDVARLTWPSWITQVEAEGEIAVLVSLGRDGLPVRIDYDIEPGTITRLDFSGWGQPVDIEPPTGG